MTRGHLAALMGLLLVLSTGCGDGGNGRPPGATATATTTATTLPTATPTAVATATARATVSATVAPPALTATRTCDCSPTMTPTASASPSPSRTPAPPEITYFGVARADDFIQTTDLFDAAGRPIFVRLQGQGMTLVLEAQRGALPLDENAYDPLGGLPGAQLLVSRPLGDGSPAVCDYNPPIIGGIPGVDPPQFSDDPMVVNAINDLGCRVNDGAGVPTGRTSNSACTHDASFEFSFVERASDLQFCLPVARAWAFPIGDTIVAARVQDIQGHVSATREIVVRVAGEMPFDCESGLGERDFTPARPGSALRTSVQPGDVSLDPWVSDPLRICAGPDLGGGVHPLALREDAVIGIPLSDGSTLCAKLAARGSNGSLDCSGASAHDVLAVINESGTSGITVTTGLGLAAGTGAASIRLPISGTLLAVGSSSSACKGVTNFDFTFDGALTTANGLAEVLGAGGGPVAQLSAVGVNFDCDAWRTGNVGTLVLPFPAVGTSSGSLAAALVLQD